MNKMTYIPKLKDAYLFRHITEEELTDFISRSEIIQFSQDEKIIAEGEYSPYLFSVIEGAASVTVKEPNSKEVYITTVGKGEIFGEAGIFVKVKRTANITCSENTTILRIHRNDFFNFIKERPNAGIKILLVVIYRLLKKLRSANQEIAFERKTDLDQDDVDLLINDFMNSE